jgi:hypothetical protein
MDPEAVSDCATGVEAGWWVCVYYFSFRALALRGISSALMQFKEQVIKDL